MCAFHAALARDTADHVRACRCEGCASIRRALGVGKPMCMRNPTVACASSGACVCKACCDWRTSSGGGFQSIVTEPALVSICNCASILTTGEHSTYCAVRSTPDSASSSGPESMSAWDSAINRLAETRSAREASISGAGLIRKHALSDYIPCGLIHHQTSIDLDVSELNTGTVTTKADVLIMGEMLDSLGRYVNALLADGRLSTEDWQRIRTSIATIERLTLLGHLANSVHISKDPA